MAIAARNPATAHVAPTSTNPQPNNPPRPPVTVDEATGRELLDQYTFPGLPPAKGLYDVDELAQSSPWLKGLEGESFVATARAELRATLDSSPLHGPAEWELVRSVRCQQETSLSPS